MDVALVVLKENGDTVDVQFAGARRPLYYLENNTLKAIKGSRKTIGGIFNKRVFESHQLTLAKGTMLYLGSDGLADQNSLHQHKLGSAFLQEFLEGNANLPVSDQKDKLEDLLEKHMYGVEQRDDILWMGVKI
jgi:serine phosphatase RsbU (regulator of sigma subunit)